MICEELQCLDSRTYAQIPGDTLDLGYGAVEITRTPCHFGGTRHWFVCPRCEGRKAVLYVIRGRMMCRICGGLRYRMELSTPNARKAIQLRKLFRRLGAGHASLIGPVPRRPKGMHWSTYFRIHRRIRELQVERAADMVAFLERCGGPDGIMN